MAGGIFTDRPFHLNAKCVVFSFYSSLLYAAGGGRRGAVIAAIFVVSYILLAWYDYMYDCNDHMMSGTSIGSTAIFKPQYREIPEAEQLYLRKVYFFHALLVAPLLMYVGLSGEKISKTMASLVGGTGVLALVYHGIRLKVPR